MTSTNKGNTLKSPRTCVSDIETKQTCKGVYMNAVDFTRHIYIYIYIYISKNTSLLRYLNFMTLRLTVPKRGYAFSHA